MPAGDNTSKGLPISLNTLAHSMSHAKSDCERLTHIAELPVARPMTGNPECSKSAYTFRNSAAYPCLARLAAARSKRADS